MYHKGRYVTICGREGDSEIVTCELFGVFIAPGLPLPAPNPLYPVCAGTRPRVAEVSDHSTIDPANTVGENSHGSSLFRSQLAQDGSAGATGRDHRRARLRTRSCRVE